MIVQVGRPFYSILSKNVSLYIKPVLLFTIKYYMYKQVCFSYLLEKNIFVKKKWKFFWWSFASQFFFFLYSDSATLASPLTYSLLSLLLWLTLLSLLPTHTSPFPFLLETFVSLLTFSKHMSFFSFTKSLQHFAFSLKYICTDPFSLKPFNFFPEC